MELEIDKEILKLDTSRLGRCLNLGGERERN